jgi:hypothetical protein
LMMAAIIFIAQISFDLTASNVSIPAHRMPKGWPPRSSHGLGGGIRFDDRSKSRERFFTIRAITGDCRKSLQRRALRPILQAAAATAAPAPPA